MANRDDVGHRRLELRRENPENSHPRNGDEVTKPTIF